MDATYTGGDFSWDDSSGELDCDDLVQRNETLLFENESLKSRISGASTTEVVSCVVAALAMLAACGIYGDGIGLDPELLNGQLQQGIIGMGSFALVNGIIGLSASVVKHRAEAKFVLKHQEGFKLYGD